MRATFTIEDTPQGIYPVLKWEGNGCCDNLHESITMHLMADLAAMIKKAEDMKILRVVDSKGESTRRTLSLPKKT
jgi:hypothetical protein